MLARIQTHRCASNLTEWQSSSRKKIIAGLFWIVFGAFCLIQSSVSNVEMKAMISISCCLESGWVGIAAPLPQQLMRLFF